ncbi:hypothetical protein [Ideonella sp. BN130291]|uniref:hypothetical protein n=1 Tax=Ideonella sp. BN130291 TaxID=3112940 RepID=UPI002E259F92|nr:hypothetical protein [Ideonella sp. BN130291]
MHRAHQRGTVVAFFATATLLLACSDPDARETPGEKAEWSVLQGVEYQHRASPLGEPVVLGVGEREVLGVRGLDGQNIWVLLKPSAPPFYKQMPQGNYTLPADLVDQLIRQRRVSYTVEQVLASHISRE